MSVKNKGGRPLAVTEDTLHKLEQAFAMGCTDLEACLFADIATGTLYNYQNANPKFLERKHRLKEKPILLARTELIKGLQNNPELCLKFLERKKKDEFSTRQEHDHTGGITISRDHALKIKKVAEIE